MLRCEQCQASLLDDLYGLLDPHETAALRAHLAQCPTCAAARAEAERVRSLLATAAKSEFPAVQFTPPVPTKKPTTRPAARPATRPASRGVPVLSWSIAAALLLFVAALAGPAAWFFSGYASKSDAVSVALANEEHVGKERANLDSEFNARTEQLKAEHVAAGKQMNELATKLKAELERIAKINRERELYVVVSGPETVQAGAPNRFHIDSRSVHTHNPTPATVNVRVLAKQPGEKTAAEVFKIDNIRSRGQTEVELPTDLNVKANAELSLEVVATPEGGSRSELSAQIKLGAPSYMAHLATDKAMYQPGETVRFRSLVLNRYNHTPPTEDVQVLFTLKDPMGNTIVQMGGKSSLEVTGSDGTRTLAKGPNGEPIKGIASGEYTIPADRTGGEYSLSIADLGNRFPPQERKFLINRYRPDVLEKVLDFNRKTYGPGDEVVVTAKASAGSTPVANQPVHASFRVDDFEGKPQITSTDAQGNVRVSFKLPEKIEKGAASVTLGFDYGGGVESLVKPIPVVIKKLDVEFYPEGGDLVAGVPNRVYFQARTPLGKPAELKGQLFDDTGKILATVEGGIATLNDDAEPGINQGMGRFTFTPEEGRRYELKLDRPEGITNQHRLPAVKKPSDGVVLTVADGVTGEGQPISVTVASPGGKKSLLVGAYCRGRLTDHKPVTAEPGKPGTVTLTPTAGPGGVLRVTVFEETVAPSGRSFAKPLAERLVFRRPSQKVDLTVAAGKGKAYYAPGEKAALSLTATDEKGRPAPAVLMVGVVNQSVVKMADEKTFRSMPTHFLLTSEVRKPEELEYSDVLLGSHPKAAAALDLLLGTQGWRRFAEQEPKNFQKLYQADAERVLVLRGEQSETILRNTIADQQKELAAQASQEYVAARSTREAAYTALNDPKRRDDYRQARTALDGRLTTASGATATARRDLNAFEDNFAWVRFGVLPLTCLVLLCVGMVSMFVAVLRRGQGVPFYVTSAASVGVCVLMMAAVISTTDFNSNNATPTAVVQNQAGRATKAERAAVEWAEDVRIAGENQPENPVGNPDLDIPAALEPAKPGVRAAAPAGPNRAWDKKAEGGPPAPGAAGLPGKPAEKADDQLKGDKRREGFAGKPGDAADLAPFDRGRRAVEEQAKEMEPRGKAANLAGGKGEAKGGELKDAAKQGDRQNNRPEEARKQLQGADGKNGLRDQLIYRELEMLGKGKAMLGAPAGPQADGLNIAEIGVEQVPALPPTPIRQYAHVHASQSKDRTDFTETVFWHPAIVLSSDGSGTVSFDLSDSIGRYQVIVAGHTLDGRLGATVFDGLEARKAFSAEPRFPLEVTAGDRIDMPVGIFNDTHEARPVLVRVPIHEGLIFENAALPGFANAPEQHLDLRPGQRVNRLFRFRPGIVEGKARIVVEGQSAPFQDDRIDQTLKVVAEGFPVTKAHSDLLEKVARPELNLPAGMVKGTLKAHVSMYPSTMADLQKGLEGLLREPNGCFEQTSTTNYPNLLILDYLKTSDQAAPEVSQRARRLLESGYAKLTHYECADTPHKGKQGFEWFGAADAPHEALTAYGLMQFRDMARVHQVDPKMIERTQNYLLSRLDKKTGHFGRNARALDTFGRAPDDITDAYIAWALTEGSKDDDLGDTLKIHFSKASQSDDPYFIALVANTLLNRGERENAGKLLDKLAAVQAADGSLTGKLTSITGSGGRDLQTETTALAVLAWLKDNNAPKWSVKDAPVDKAVKWIGKQRGGYGGYGATQATILALKALLTHANANRKTAESGTLTVIVNAKRFETKFEAGVKDAVVVDLPDVESILKEGANDVQIEVTGQHAFPYTLTWAYNTLKPEGNDKCPIRVGTKLNAETAEEGQSVRLTATVENVTDRGQAMTVAVIGLPAGLTVPPDMKQLKELATLREGGTKPGTIAFFELRGTRELVLYWRDMAPKQKVEVNLDLICAVPGEYRGPASRAYLYYNADHKHWVDPLKVAIAGKPSE